MTNGRNRTNRTNSTHITNRTHMTNWTDGETTQLEQKTHIGQLEQVSHRGHYSTYYHDCTWKE